jgi:putative membrane protein
MYHAWNGGMFSRGFPGGPGGYAAGFPWGGLIMGLLFVALIALVIVAIVRLDKARGLGQALPQQRGIEILMERFAKGEIDAETYRVMKAELDSKK